MTITADLALPEAIARELNTPFPITDEQVELYRELGYIKLKQVLSPAALAFFAREITTVVRETPPESVLPQRHVELLTAEGHDIVRRLAERARSRRSDSTYAQAFTQRPNIWNLSPVVEALVRSRRLAQLAADLIGVNGVRLYHDQALYKEPHGGHTPWHCDQFYWPLSNANTTTIWIPLQAVPLDMGPLAFAAGSHRLEGSQGRELAISDESEETIGRLMEGFEVDNSPFELGEVSFHAGWMFHRADPNRSDRVRAAFTIIYMDKDVRVIEPRYPQHAVDHALWLPGTKAGDPAATPINPILFER